MKHFTLSLLLCISAITCFAQTATKPSGSGTETNPYLIANLKVISKN